MVMGSSNGGMVAVHITQEQTNTMIMIMMMAMKA